MFDILKKLIHRKPKPISSGDLVVCIDDRPINSDSFAPPLKYGQVYKVSNIAICQRCRKKVIDVGLIPAISRFTKCGCDGKRAMAEFPGANIHWAGEFRFRRLEKREISRIKDIDGVKTVDLI